MKSHAILAVIAVFFILSSIGHAQVVTLEKLRACKNEVLEDYIDIPDSKIKYPITGMVYISLPSSLQGEVIVEVELWVIDADGRIVYNTVYAGSKLGKETFEPGYMKYMQNQGKAIMRTKREKLD